MELLMSNFSPQFEKEGYKIISNQQQEEAQNQSMLLVNNLITTRAGWLFNFIYHKPIVN